MLTVFAVHRCDLCSREETTSVNVVPVNWASVTMKPRPGYDVPLELCEDCARIATYAQLATAAATFLHESGR